MKRFLIALGILQPGVPQIGAGIKLRNISAFLQNPRAKKIYILVFILICAVNSLAQNFHAEGSLPKVDSNGFYRILISPEATPYLNERLNNLRIHDFSGKEVPYLLEEEQPVYSREQFKEYPILEKKQLKGCCTSLILNNPGKRSISNISLLIKNAEVSKYATLLGSDDRKEWYALKEHFVVHSISNSSGTSEMKVLDFPLTNYNYLTLRIDDSTSAPLNILKAGYYDVLTAHGNYTEIRVNKISTLDSASLKKTYIHLNLDTTHILDKLDLTFQGPPYFLRKAQLWKRISRETKEGQKKFYELVTSFEVNSKGPSALNLPELKTDALRIVIDNGDNPALIVNSIKVYQLNRYMVAWLEKDEQYKVKFGDEKVIQPDYDLTFFKDSIPAQPPVLELGEISRIGSEVPFESSPTFFTTKYFIWIAIIVVIALLGFLSVRLVREASGTHREKEN